MKRKISVAIDEDLLEWIHSEIGKKRFASASHAVNYALNETRKRENL
jgi:Arc/MetJ-type ribon-helix-helix transcriptional regulator